MRAHYVDALYYVRCPDTGDFRVLSFVRPRRADHCTGSNRLSERRCPCERPSSLSCLGDTSGKAARASGCVER